MIEPGGSDCFWIPFTTSFSSPAVYRHCPRYLEKAVSKIKFLLSWDVSTSGEDKKQIDKYADITIPGSDTYCP